MVNEKIQSSAVETTFIFLCGALIGSAVSYYYTKKFYSKKADEGVAEVLERFGNKDIPEEEDASEKIVFAGDVVELRSIIPNSVVEKYEAAKSKPMSPPEDYSKEDKSEELDEDDFVQDDDYDKETVIYYKNNEVLTDQFDRVIDVKDIFNEDAILMLDGTISSLKAFSERGKDVGYVRNRYFKTDYEICFENQDAPETALREGDLND